MKHNIVYEAYHWLKHVVRVFLGMNSYYYMRNHKRQRLTDNLRKTLHIDHVVNREDQNLQKNDRSFPYPPHTSE
ncbi:MAG TPA: hypothetical protein PLE74_09910 [Candidatus Cloacimonadota bacterium]|nr:hypothetical protein [Candidatus Cloacimonadota bacterium]HPT72580.1 hypothetical protein [Candidatus Cloacimonadota bacterium]